MNRGADPDAGFSLLEVLVALAVLSLTLGAIYSAYGSGLSSARTASERLDATLFGRSKLEELLVDPAAEAFPLQGIYEETWAWEARIEPLPPLAPSRYDDLVVTYRVIMDVSSIDGRPLAQLEAAFLATSD